MRTAAVSVILALATTAAHATPNLTYDTPVITAAPGQTVTIFATFSLGTTDAAITTDASGVVQLGYAYGALNYLIFPYEQQFTLFFPGSIFQSDSFWQPSLPNPLANISLRPGQSIDLDLGTLTLSADLPAGTYTTDIGVAEGCPAPYPGSTISCQRNYNAPPDYNAGPLTFRVGVPEPATLPTLIVGAVAIALVRRRKSSIG